VFRVTQGHWQCHHSIQCMQLPIHLLQKLCICLCVLHWFQDIVSRKSHIFPTIEISPRSLASENYCVAFFCLTRFPILIELQLMTDRGTHTDRHMATAHTLLAQCHAVKMMCGIKQSSNLKGLNYKILNCAQHFKNVSMM